MRNIISLKNQYDLIYRTMYVGGRSAVIQVCADSRIGEAKVESQWLSLTFEILILAPVVQLRDSQSIISSSLKCVQLLDRRKVDGRGKGAAAVWPSLQHTAHSITSLHRRVGRPIQTLQPPGKNSTADVLQVQENKMFLQQRKQVLFRTQMTEQIDSEMSYFLKLQSMLAGGVVVVVGLPSLLLNVKIIIMVRSHISLIFCFLSI